MQRKKTYALCFKKENVPMNFLKNKAIVTLNKPSLRVIKVK